MQDGQALALRIINAVAPIRVCDNGGWTDTWFAGYGRIFNIAVLPGVEVQLAVFERSARREQVRVWLESPNAVRTAAALHDHPLLAATLAELPPPSDLALEITIFSHVPAGASTGTSAAVTVALLGALDSLTPGQMSAHQIARAAHRVETERLGWQSGIQDQLSAAYGGVNLIEMPSYPEAVVSPLALAPALAWELERRLVLIFLGATHSSSAVHQQVIARLEQEGSTSEQLEALRQAASRSHQAVLDGDLAALGQAMIANTNAQRKLHPALVNADAEALIVLAQQYGCVGWKINGAGGAGGSLSVLCGADAAEQRAFLHAVRQQPLLQIIPTTLDFYGLRVWDAAVNGEDNQF